jgi:hypothetical protein
LHLRWAYFFLPVLAKAKNRTVKPSVTGNFSKVSGRIDSQVD